MASKTHQIRSLSLPSKLNPINHKIKEQLKKLRIKEEFATSASESIINGINGVAELYKCINQALGLPMTQQALSLRQHEKRVAEILRGCSAVSNVCTSILNVVQNQEAITKVLLSCLSDEIDSSETDSNVADYFSARKEVIRKAKDVLLSLNQLNAQLLVEENDHLTTLIRSLRCVTMINLSVFGSLLDFFSKPTSKPKRSLVSKLTNKGSINTDTGNEINDVDSVLQDLVSSRTVNDGKMCFSLGKLSKLVSVIEGIESGLANMSTQLSVTKVCLMNIVLV